MSHPKNTPFRILLASMVGTTIEFFDFYIFATAAVLVFPKLFFPAADPTAQTLQSLAAFSLAFFARPAGSLLFGHFGDRLGRKATLVAALLTMGLSTVAIGLLPGYGSIGIAATILLCVFRVGQGIGLGGEWGGAVLLATENAPAHRKALYGLFPQLGAPVGFILSTGTFLLLTRTLPEADFLAWGWRIPFISSILLVGLGLWVRLSIEETGEYKALSQSERPQVPLVQVVTRHYRPLLLGTLAALATFALFYIMTVWSLGWGVNKLGYPRPQFLIFQILGAFCFAGTIFISGLWADRIGRRFVLSLSAVLVIAFGLALPHLFVSGHPALTCLMICLGLSVMGFTYGPLGTALAEAYPTAVRYTGASLSFNAAGILGASLTPMIATSLAASHGLSAVGLYLVAAGGITLAATLILLRTRANANRT